MVFKDLRRSLSTLKKLFVFLISLLLVSCGQTNNEQSKSETLPIEKSQVNVNREYIEKEVLFNHDLYELGFDDVPTSGLEKLVENISEMNISNEEEPYFVTYWLLNYDKINEQSIEKIYRDTKIRMLYEQTWMEVAEESYDVTLDNDKLDKLISEEWDILKKAKIPASLAPFLDISGYSYEDFFKKYESKRIEKAALSLELLPILEENYKVENTETLLYEYFHLEVMEELLRKLD